VFRFVKLTEVFVETYYRRLVLMIAHTSTNRLLVPSGVKNKFTDGQPGIFWPVPGENQAKGQRIGVCTV